jgi:hypothetical protein
VHLHEEPHLLGRSHSGALHHLSEEVGSERNDLRGLERRVGALLGGQGSGGEEGREVERGESVEDDDFVGRVGVDGLVEREVSRVGVEGAVVGRVPLCDLVLVSGVLSRDVSFCRREKKLG